MENFWESFRLDPRQAGNASMRASDADRELIRTVLADAYGDGRLTRTLGISLQGASPGEYALVLAVKDEKTGETLSVAEPFTIVP